MMKDLIKGQSIMIDDHKRAHAHGFFDDEKADIHLDKKAKSGNYRIRIPLNTNRPVDVELKSSKKKLQEIPENIAREIREIFANDNVRRDFVEALIKELKNYPYADETKEKDKRKDINKAFGALRRLSKYFGLDWSNKTVRGFLKEYKTFGLRCMVTITDGPDMYFMSVDRLHFVIADYMMIGIHDRSSWKELTFEEINAKV